MHAKSGLRVVLKWKIYRPDSVIADVIPLKQMPNFSIRSLMFLFVYFAICASIYITQNLAAGWAVVIATAILIVTSTMYAF